MKKQSFSAISKTPEVPADVGIKQLGYSWLAVFLAGETAIIIGTLLFFFNRGLDSNTIFISLGCTTLFFLLFTTAAYIYTRNIWNRVFISEDRLLSISSISTDAIFSVDTDFMITAWSKGAERVFGYTQEDAVGSSIAIILPDDFLKHDQSMMNTLSEKGVVRLHRSFRKTRDGRILPVDISASELTLPDGLVAGYIVAIRDISNPVRMEKDIRESAEQLKESKERYQNLFESSNDGLLYLDLDRRILQCNQAFADMLEYPIDKLVGLSFEDLTPPEWQAVDDDVFANQLPGTGRSDEYTKEFTRKDGSPVPALVRCWMVNDSERPPKGVWVIARDVGERKQYEDFIRETLVRLEDAYDELQETDRLKTEFVAVVSHELRAPLAATQSSLDTLSSLREGKDSPDEMELMEILDRGIHRLSHLVADLMELTRIETGQLGLDKATANASDITSRVATLFGNSFNEKGLKLILEHPDGPCPLDCDSRRVEQVLSNLVDNALKFTEKGEVIVTLECTPNRVIFSVSDTGPGVPPELHEKIFGKFYCSNLNDNSNRQGIGLGLAISRGIVKAHGGSIWVESHENAGVTFAFNLPRDPIES
ncbi:MAG: PAS domain-containing sensor histidine kinase [Actinobacteria bacterium]|nr:PAS domain-containing sensor histidine kinase [Actinomycetota bacterium]